MSHRLHVANLRAAAARSGDTSDAKIARRAGLGTATISRLVNHLHEPTLTTISKLAAAYDLTVEQLTDGADDFAEAS